MVIITEIWQQYPAANDYHACMHLAIQLSLAGEKVLRMMYWAIFSMPLTSPA
jgi:hypothetical protein